MITVGIVSFNRLKYMTSLIESLSCLDRNKFRISVVDNGSWESGLTEFLKYCQKIGKIDHLTCRPTAERNWINDEYIAKNIIIEECKDDVIVFLQDDLQFIGSSLYLEMLCDDFMKMPFLCMEFNGIRRATNMTKFASKNFAQLESGLKYWISDKPHFQTMGIFKKKTFDEFGMYPTNWPKDRAFWGRSEDYYDNIVKKKYNLINASCHFPAFLGVWNDHRGGYAFFRNDLRYGDYTSAPDISKMYYKQYDLSTIMLRQNSDTPLSFVDVASPLGWDFLRSYDGDQAKYSQNEIVNNELGQLIK